MSIRSLVAVVTMLIARLAMAQNTVLPPPTGPREIARVTYAWRDSSRAAFLDEGAAGRREVVVDVWYPSRSTASRARAPYLADIASLRRLMPDSVLRRRFDPSYALVASGRLTTHAADGGPVACRTHGCPLIVFSHGGGVDRASYTAQYEDLASHGYIVAAIAHPYDTHIVVLPSDRLVTARPQPPDTVEPNKALPAWRQELAREARSQAYLRRVLAAEAADVRFVVDELLRMARDGASPFAGTIDGRIGAAGHSAGGEAAALACQLDARIKACLNQDGAIHGLPFPRDGAGRTMSQPFLYFTRLIPRPKAPNEALATMQITRRELDSVNDDVTAGPVRLLNDLPAGGYRLLLNVPGMNHLSFSDEPLLRAVGDPVNSAHQLVALALVRKYTLAFFDKTLLGQADTPLERVVPADTALLRIERYPPRP